MRLHGERHWLAQPLAEYLEAARGVRVFVLIPEVDPEHLWQRILQNQRGAILAHALLRHSDAIVCRLRFRVAAGPGRP